MAKIYSLIFAEPSTFDYTINYVVLDVTSDMYEKIKQGGRELTDCDSNAYLFGDPFDIDEYESAGFHDVSLGQTGFIEKNIAKKKHREGNLTCDYEDFIDRTQFKCNDPVCIKAVQETHPEIIWVGKVNNNAKRVHLHFHVSPNDVVDSVIVDNEYYLYATYDTDETTTTTTIATEDTDDTEASA